MFLTSTRKGRPEQICTSHTELAFFISFRWLSERFVVLARVKGATHTRKGSMKSGIEGVQIVPLARIPDERGAILHMLRKNDEHFVEFGEIYFSLAFPGIIKGWHEHTRQTQNYAVPIGMIKLVLFDRRPLSKSTGNLLELFVGELNYCLVTIPPGVINGYKVVGQESALVANCATLPHEPDEMERYDPLSDVVPYTWDLVMR